MKFCKCRQKLCKQTYTSLLDIEAYTKAHTKEDIQELHK